MTSQRKRAKLRPVDYAIILFGVVLCGLFVYPVLSKLREVRVDKVKSRCRSNLAAIGKALSTYANDYDRMPPIAGGPGTRWGPGLANWAAEKRTDAFALDPNGTGGQATVSSSLYLLVRYTELAPEFFVCPMEKQTEVFDPRRYGMGDKPLADLWDFGPEPARHCSYAYQMVYAPFRPQSPKSLSMVVAADRNPWIDSPWSKAADFSRFRPKHGLFNRNLGNSRAHRGDGQNRLFLAGHVFGSHCSYATINGYHMRSWDEKHELEIVEDDNIYTSWDGQDRQRGIAPKPYVSKPAHEFDSLVVNDPPLGR